LLVEIQEHTDENNGQDYSNVRSLANDARNYRGKKQNKNQRASEEKQKLDDGGAFLSPSKLIRTIRDQSAVGILMGKPTRRRI
jgi:hypothetical protein